MKRITVYSVQQVKEKSGLYDLDTKKITSPTDAVRIINEVLHLKDAAVEHFVVMCLNTKNQVTGIYPLFKGAIDHSIVNPREVFQAALLSNARSIICFHNHPSGDPTPSREDKQVTERLIKAGDVIGVEVLDHIIVAESYFSFKEYGLM